MRLPVLCPLCLDAGESRQRATVLVPIGDQGVCQVHCLADHTTAVVLEEHRHEWLFETALCAIEDGYYREAVSSFAASMDRFYEYVLSIYCEASQVSEDAFTSTWKPLSKQSERQLGAFVIAHTLLEKRPPSTLSDKNVQFRNDVVHKGRMPTEDQAIAFGDAMFEIFVPLLLSLRGKYAVAKAAIDNRLRRENFKHLPPSVARTTRYSLPMALRDVDPNNVPPHPTRHYVERLAGYLERE